MKFKNSVGFILMCLLLFITPIVMAESENFDDVLTIKISAIDIPNFTEEDIISIEFNVEFISEEDPFNNHTFTFTLYENKSLSISEGNILYRVIAEGTTVENIDFKDEADRCLAEKIGYERGWQLCQNDLIEYEGENATIYKESFDECTLTIKEKDLDITSKSKEIEDLNDEKEETKNAKYFWGIGGAVIGILGLLLYRGELGKEKAKDKSQGEFNPSQAG